MGSISVENVVCSKCRNSLPHTREFFIPRKECRNGLTRVCRSCTYEQDKVWIKNNKKKYSERRAARYKDNPGKWRQWREKNPLTRRLSALLADAKKRAKERGLAFDECITVGLLRDQLFLSPECPCCSVPFSCSRQTGSKQYEKNPATPSLDRFDSSKGYTLDNVSLICWRCNNVKGDATASELEAVVRWMRLR